jgi:hypothetical protein
MAMENHPYQQVNDLRIYLYIRGFSDTKKTTSEGWINPLHPMELPIVRSVHMFVSHSNLPRLFQYKEGSPRHLSKKSQIPELTIHPCYRG